MVVCVYYCHNLKKRRKSSNKRAVHRQRWRIVRWKLWRVVLVGLLVRHSVRRKMRGCQQLEQAQMANSLVFFLCVCQVHRLWWVLCRRHRAVHKSGGVFLPASASASAVDRRRSRKHASLSDPHKKSPIFVFGRLDWVLKHDFPRWRARRVLHFHYHAHGEKSGRVIAGLGAGLDLSLSKGRDALHRMSQRQWTRAAASLIRS